VRKGEEVWQDEELTTQGGEFASIIICIFMATDVFN